MAEVYLIDDSLIAEHAKEMIGGRALTAKELRFAVRDVRRQLDRDLQGILETAILYAVRTAKKGVDKVKYGS